MTAYAVTSNATGSVRRFGYAHFSTDATESEVSVNEGQLPVEGVALKYQKVDSGDFCEMSAAEKTAVDTELEAIACATLCGCGCLPIFDEGDLPATPPYSNRMILVNDGGTVRLAVTTATGYLYFDHT